MRLVLASSCCQPPCPTSIHPDSKTLCTLHCQNMKLTSACRAPNPFQAARHKPQGVPAARVHVVCQAGDAPAPQRPPTGPRPGPPSAGGGVRPAVSAIRPGPPGARPGTAVPLGPDGKPLEVISIEKAGSEAWAGVAQIDKGDESFDYGSAAVLALGDAVAISAFAIIGRVSHGEPINADAFLTAAPFLAGWFLTAPFLGAFGKEARSQGIPSAAGTAVKASLVGVPLGVVLRSVSRGYMPAPTFIAVSLVVNTVLLVIWRSALAAATKQEAPAAAGQRKDKTGNPFEFLSLLSNLTTRW